MGTDIGTTLLAYDVKSNNVGVKDALMKKGYSDNWRYGKGTTYYMPDTTLWHDKKSTDQAIADLKSVCSTLHVTIDRAVAVRASDFAGV